MSKHRQHASVGKNSMTRACDWTGFSRAFGLATLLAGVSTAALADPGAQQDPRDAQIQQLQSQVQQLVAKSEELQAEIAALQQGQAAQSSQAGRPGVQSIQTAEAAQPAAERPKADDGSLTWHGITIYGTYDVGVGWVSHGLPESGFNYEGESLVNRNGNHSQFLIAPNNLSQTGLGIRGKEELLPGWFAVFNASTGINPQSGQLANLAATNTSDAGLPRARYMFAGDGARAGQAFNDELFVGISSTQFGTLTVGRQRALGVDAITGVRSSRRSVCLFRSSATTA